MLSPVRKLKKQNYSSLIGIFILFFLHINKISHNFARYYLKIHFV